MKHGSDTHLTYCLNVHPGDDWASSLQNIRNHALRIRDRVEARPFGLGLRVSDTASRELANDAEREQFRAFMADENLYAFTVNAFPFASFHKEPVKQRVYEPDWTHDARVDYTNRVASILAELLPAGMDGSISTVPGSYKAWITTDDQVRKLCENLAESVIHLILTERIADRYLHIGLEPEPDCYLETTDETIAFLNGPMQDLGVPYIANRLNISRDKGAELLKRHLGVCLDTCHSALQFEDPAENIQRYAEAGILISKIQISAALRCAATPDNLAALAAFDDPVYLHQVKASTDNRIHGFRDLPDALAHYQATPAEETELRIHFHVPLHFDSNGPLHSTRDTMTPAFFALAKQHCRHLEIETYTFDVLPDDLRTGDVCDSTCEEYQWLISQLPDES